MTAQDTLKAGNWLVRYGTGADPAYRVVCFPHAGGSASYYPWLRAAVPPEGELVCLQYPGRQERRREAAIEQFPAMVGAIAAVVGGEPEVPLVFYGHSLGSLIAFETALALQKAGRPVHGLIVSGRRAPSVRPPNGMEMAEDDKNLVAAMRELGGIDPALLRDPEVLELILPALRADFRLANSYVPEPAATLLCPVTVLNGHTDPQASAADAGAWRGHTTGGFVFHQVEGGHFFTGDDRWAVIGLIRNTLEELLPPDGSSAPPGRS